MSRKKDKAASRTGAATTVGGFPAAVIISRWLLVLAISALVAFGSQTEPGLAHYSLLAAVIASNVALSLLRQRIGGFSDAVGVVTITDVIAVSLIIGWIDPSTELYAAVFASLVVASALGRVGMIMLMTSLLCAVYAGYLYTEIGPNFWRQVELIVIVPFVFAVGLHFANVASFLKRERTENVGGAEKARREARTQAERAEHISKEQDRLRALGQIGRLGLTATGTKPDKVLLEMGERARDALRAERYSLILFEPEGAATARGARAEDLTIEVRTLPLEPAALTAILPQGNMTELHPGESKDLMKLVKVFFPDSNPFGSLLVAPIKTDDKGFAGAVFLIDKDHKRTYSDGERDFFWTVSLMTGAFIQARERLENEVRLRTLINAAPVIMFALGNDGTIRLFEGRGAAVLDGDPAKRVGKSIFDVAENPEETREAFDEALSGRLVEGTLLIDGILFETQYSPLHGVDGNIAGVMGVTTAILDASTPAPEPVAAPTAQPPAPEPVAEPTAPPPAPEPVAAPTAQPPAPEPVAAPTAQPPAPKPVAAPTAQPPAPEPVVEPTAPPPAPEPVATPTAQPPPAPQAVPDAPEPVRPAQPEPASVDPAPEPTAPAEPPSLPRKVDPYAARKGLKPSIPLADEDPDTDTP